jgi:5-methylcytosine-specific restriction enzyme subunit McrC
MPATVITLFEHQYRSYAEIGLYPGNPALRERFLAKLERINEIAGQEILHLGRKGLQANALVGVLRVGEITFEIFPKIDYPPADREIQRTPSKLDDHQNTASKTVQSATKNLLSLLSYAYDLRLRGQDVAGLATQQATWMELLSRLFAVGLHQEILSGLSQEYVSREESLKVLRGRWDVQRQLRQPGDDPLSFQVVYDDLSPDIPLNQVFRFVVERLLTTSQDAQNQVLLRDLAERLLPAALLPQVSPELLASIRFTSLNERFEPAFNLARMFLSGNAIQIAVGDQAAYAFVFDMNLLFERFIAGFIGRHRQEIFPEAWQDIAVISQSEGAGLYLARWEGKSLFRLRPDLLFKRSNQPAPVLIADAKYKQLSGNQRRPGIAPEDAYQMLAYSVRYQCPHGLLFYPQPQPDHAVRISFEIASPELKVQVASINLRTPLEPPDSLIREFQNIFHSCAQ